MHSLLYCLCVPVVVERVGAYGVSKKGTDRVGDRGWGHHSTAGTGLLSNGTRSNADKHHLIRSLCVLRILCIWNKQKASAKKSGGSKKPLSGFMLFSKEHRPKIKEDSPDLTFGGIGKKLGEMWRALSEKEKQAYKDRKA
jgi:hypothetical protein